jgi:CRISPR-associated protein Cmr4
LLYSVLLASKPRVKDDELPDDWKQAADRAGKVMEFVKDCVDGKRIQLGGDRTVGRGFVAVRVHALTQSDQKPGEAGGEGDAEPATDT